MKSAGEKMIIGIKDSLKLFGVAVIMCCAVFVCTLFLNLYPDMEAIKSQVVGSEAETFYAAQLATAKIVCAVSGGCLLATSVVTLFFYIKRYVDMHRSDLGILKALGYPDGRIARDFGVFGFSVLLGGSVGFAGAWAYMPAFYRIQNKGDILPEIPLRFHPALFLLLVVLPAVLFALLAVIYALKKLKGQTIGLLKNSEDAPRPLKKFHGKKRRRTFLKELRRTVLRSKKTLAFFIFFSAFCFSAMTQMSLSMKDLASEDMGALIMIIGLVLAFATLLISVVSVADGNKTTVSLLRAMGYTQRECAGAVLNGYRPLALLGFAVGSIYQYGLLRIMVELIFRELDFVPEYSFDFPTMGVCLACFVLLYESIMYFYARKMEKVSIKYVFD